MNLLSWSILLFYAVEALGYASTFISVGLFMGILISLLYFAGSEGDEEARKSAGKSVKVFTVAFTIVFSIAVILPSKHTMLLIAGSELGERILKSHGAQRLINPSLEMIESWIRSEIKNLKEYDK